MRGSLATKMRVAQRGTTQLQHMNIGKTSSRSYCSLIFGRGPFKDKLYAFFIAQFDASIVVLPFLFRRAGWTTCVLLLAVL